MTKRDRSRVSALVALACLQLAFTAGAGSANARHHYGDGMKRCMHELMHAHADALKTRLKLSPAQVKQIEAIRSSLWTTKGKLAGQLEQERANGKILWQGDLPDQGKALAHLRKVHNLRGQMREEKLKAHLKILALLSKDQRAQLRTQCAEQGMKGMGCKGGGCPGSGHCPHCAKGGPPWSAKGQGGGCPHCGTGSAGKGSPGNSKGK